MTRNLLYVAQALTRLAGASPGQRYRHKGRCNRLDSRIIRVARTHARRASDCRAKALALLGAT